MMLRLLSRALNTRVLLSLLPARSVAFFPSCLLQIPTVLRLAKFWLLSSAAAMSPCLLRVRSTTSRQLPQGEPTCSHRWCEVVVD